MVGIEDSSLAISGLTAHVCWFGLMVNSAAP